jgi:phosphoribosylaminoimidazole-succinocarboxamide synthase
VTDGLKHLGSGKVRELYAVGDDQLLLVASDRISAFDWVLRTPIPDKGRILTQLSLWWFEQLTGVPNHVAATDPDDFPADLALTAEQRDELRGRSMLCRKLDMVPVECVARGYLAGSGLTEYELTGEVCGVPLPRGLTAGSRLPAPIFTPTTKAPVGEHDEHLSFETIAELHGESLARRLRTATLDVYTRAHEIAAGRGLVLADTKFEFGLDADGELVLADEVLTPDSSRFWELEHGQVSYDKQFVRDWLTSPASGWDRHSGDAPPELPPGIVEHTRARYVEAYERLTGCEFR